MHPEIMWQLAKLKIAEEHAWADRERRARIARGASAPDAVAFGGHVEHLSFAARVRALVGSLRAGGGTAEGATSA